MMMIYIFIQIFYDLTNYDILFYMIHLKNLNICTFSLVYETCIIIQIEYE
jgi:hypothetical protein